MSTDDELKKQAKMRIFYLALGYVKNGQITNAKQQLKLIPASSCHKKEAMQLLSK